MIKNNKSKKPKSRNRNRSTGQGSTNFQGMPVPSLPRQLSSNYSGSSELSNYPNVVLDFPIDTQILTTTVTSSTFASLAIDPTTLINAFSSRLATLFNEYAFLGCRLTFRLNGNTDWSGGRQLGWCFDEDNSTSLTFAQTVRIAHTTIMCVNGTAGNSMIDIGKEFKKSYKPRAFSTISFVPMATSSVPFYSKFALSANATAGGIAIGQTEGTIRLALRGFV